MAPTVERSQPRGGGSRGPNLTPYERGRIVQAYEDGRTLENIADQFQRAPSTISRTIYGASTHDQGNELARTGRPRSYMVFQLFLYLAHWREHEGVGAGKAAKRLALRNFCRPTVPASLRLVLLFTSTTPVTSYAS